MVSETLIGIMPIVTIVGFMAILYMMVTRSVYGRGSNISTAIALMVGLLLWMAIFPSFLDIMGFDDEPDCIQEDWVDCDLYNIPRDECEKDVTEEGPYYDVRTVTKYTNFTCTRWDDGSVLQP